MKDLNRNGRPFPPLTYRREEQNDLRVCRVRLGFCADHNRVLRQAVPAKGYVHRIAAHVPDSYISFQQNEQASLRYSGPVTQD